MPVAVSFLCHFPSAFAASLARASCPAVSGLPSTPEGAAVTRPARRILARESLFAANLAAAFGAEDDARARVHHELAADEALERGASKQRQQLLLERAGDRRDLGHSSRKTPTTRPSTCRCLG